MASTSLTQATVNRMYHNRFADNLHVPAAWSGDNARCAPGQPSARYQASMLESLNFVRALNHLAPVTFSSSLSRNAQSAALIMSAADGPTHYPSRSWSCWSSRGATAASSLNLALATPSLDAGKAVGMYMTEAGASSTAVGHRRWVLNPFVTAMGDGATGTTNALWVFGPNNYRRPNPSWVSWPSAGWFPNALEPSGRWSLSAGNSHVSFHYARVAVRNSAGTRLSTRVQPVENGYGQPTLVWQVAGLRSTGTYRVTVSNIRRYGARGTSSHTYSVRLFTPKAL